MRFVTVRELRGTPRQIWNELAQRGEMIITSNGKPIAILTAASEETLEQSLAAIRAARAVQAVQQIQRQSMKKGGHKIKLSQINDEIRGTRRRKSA